MSDPDETQIAAARAAMAQIAAITERELSAEEAQRYLAARDVVVAARQAQLARRRPLLERYKRELRFCDLVITQGMGRFGGSLPEEITPRDPELLLWGLWLRDAKRAMDAAGRGARMTLPALPPVPSWFQWNPAVAKLADALKLKRAPSAKDRKP